MSIFDRWRRFPEDESEPDEALQQLLQRARSLPSQIEPQRDLWSGVANRIRAQREPSTRPLFGIFPRPALAAAFGLALVMSTALATFWLAQPSLPTTDAEFRLLANELRERDGVSTVHQSLLAMLETRRDELPTEALLALEDNVRRIDRALAELSVAMREYPEHPELNFLLAETYQREADLLERMEWWMQTPPGAES